MELKGQFRDVENRLYEVEIWDTTTEYGSDTITIGEDGLYFSDDPVVIQTEADDLFQHIIIHSCQITLLTKDYVGEDLFQTDSRSMRVTVKEMTNQGPKYIFYGWVTPQTFNQPFATPLDEFTIDATDCLGTLQYHKYNDTTIDSYALKVKTADLHPVRYYLNQLIDNYLIARGNVLYDKSIGLTNTPESLSSVFDDISISDITFYDKDADHTWTWYEVFESLLKYFNLHAVQIGNYTYLFNWNTLKKRRNTWRNFNTQEYVVSLPTPTIGYFTKAMHAQNDTNISVDEAYNQISLTDKMNSLEAVLVSPFEKKEIKHVYGRQLFMTEYITEGEGTSAYNGMTNYIWNGHAGGYDAGMKTDWYLQHIYNDNWTFYIWDDNGNHKDIDTLAEQDSVGNYINQTKLSDAVFKSPRISAGMFRFGHLDYPSNVTSNDPQSKLEMNPYICIRVRGNRNDSETDHQPSDALLEASQPIVEYKGANNGASYSPSDENVKNYLVFSGKLMLQRKQDVSTSWENATSNDPDQRWGGDHLDYWYYPAGYGDPGEAVPYRVYNHWHQTVPSSNNGDGRYYMLRWWESTYSTGDATTKTGESLFPPFAKVVDSTKELDYNYSANGNGEDLFSKLPVLECELTIGDKRLIEYDLDMYGNSKFMWVTIGQEPTFSYVDNEGRTQYYQPKTFSIGINPKIGDQIINTEYEFQNTVDYTMEIDGSGMAIPIKYDDNLTGEVNFKILGPINTTWNEITRRHPTFFRHTKWYNNTKFILAHTEYIYIKDFQCKLYSKNEDYQDDGKNLTYLSNADNYINAKSDISFDLITQPTLEQCINSNMKYKTCSNVFSVTSTKSPAVRLYNAADIESGIPEELYVNHYYEMCHAPKIMLNGTFHLREIDAWRNVYRSQALGDKDFFIFKMNQSLRYNNGEVTFREI